LGREFLEKGIRHVLTRCANRGFRRGLLDGARVDGGALREWTQ